MPVGGPDQLLPVGAEHREAVEVGIPGHLLEPGAVGVDQEQVEVTAPRIEVVRREDDSPSVGVKERREVGAAKRRDFPRMLSVGIGYPELELGGPDQPLTEELAVVGRVGRGLGVRRRDPCLSGL